jgi:hypothetical protein
VLASDHVQAANVNAFLVIGKTIEGEIKPTLDTRGAVLFGLAIGGMLGLFSFFSEVVRRSR